MNILAITTFNRLHFIRSLIRSFVNTIDTKNNQWLIIIADDGSTDGTHDYLDSLEIDNLSVEVIRNNRQGVHHQFNTIVKALEKKSYDFCFKCDDDIEFLRPGWDKLYIDAIRETGFDHLCHFDIRWRPEKILKKPITRGSLVSYCRAKDVQGAFFTLSPPVIRDVGFMDTENFGFRGVGHVDYTIRAARAGYNHPEHPFDVSFSNDYIGHQKGPYASAMNRHLVNALESDKESKRKYELIQDNKRVYIDFFDNPPSLTTNLERDLLITRLEALEHEKQWYESTYGHQPRWFVRLGKLLFKILRGRKP
ncbi:MAG: glycosyltransferase [Cyclobacteriaceae bacterium]|nr:glycosyltransferase [Cyclobacteriaceae bacterium]